MLAADTSAAPDHTSSGRALRVTLYVIAAFQLVLGAAFLVSPRGTAALFGLPEAPGWTGWLFAMMAARFLGYGWGLIVAARDPAHNRAWIDSMAMIQVIDWLATVGYLASGEVTLRQVATASFVPLLFALALVRFRPRGLPAQSTSSNRSSIARQARSADGR